MRQSKHTGPFVLPYDLRYQERPPFIPKADLNLFDERPDEKAVPSKPETLTIDEIAREPDGDRRASPSARRARENPSDQLPPPRVESAPLLSRVSEVFRDLVPNNHSGAVAVSRAALVEAGLTARELMRARDHELSRLVDHCITPGMPPDRRKSIAAWIGPHNARVRKRAALLEELADFLVSLELREAAGARIDDDLRSGRVEVRYDEKRCANVVDVWRLRRPHPSWDAPTLAMSATMPSPAVLSLAEDRPVTPTGTIAIEWPDDVRVRQLVHAEMGARKTGSLPTSAPDDGKMRCRALWRFIALRAALIWPGKLGVVCRKELVEKLRRERTETVARPPENVEFKHFGALTGMNDWENVAGLVMIGAPQPARQVFERAAGVLSGVQPNVIPADEHGGFWYPTRPGGLRLRDGRAFPVKHVYHPDPLVEELRRVACEGEMIQALGRVRAIWRTGRSPCFVDIISDVPLPITVDEVVSWSKVKPEWSVPLEMVAGGVLRTNWRRWHAVYPDQGDRQARDGAEAVSALAETGKLGRFLYEKSLIGETSQLRTVSLLRVEHAGQGARAEQVIVLPNGPQTATDIHAALGVPPGVRIVKVSGRDARALAVYGSVWRKVEMNLAALLSAVRPINIDLPVAPTTSQPLRSPVVRLEGRAEPTAWIHGSVTHGLRSAVSRSPLARVAALVGSAA